MAGFFTWKRMLLAAVLVAGLPYVAPVDYNICRGGPAAQTCRNQYISHCCKSGLYLSATCCWNACTFSRSDVGWMSTHCSSITDSMCCSTSRYAPQSCCGSESFSRTSTSSINGDYLRPTYGTCTGWHTTERDYCLNSLSTACCKGTDFLTSTCCRLFTCVASYGNTDTCSSSSTHCCYSSERCCNSRDYDLEVNERSNVPGAIAGGVIGGIIFLVIIIVVPVTVVCCAKGKRGKVHADTTVAAAAGASASDNPVERQPQPDQATPVEPLTELINRVAKPARAVTDNTTEYNQPPADGNQQQSDESPAPQPTIQVE